MDNNQNPYREEVKDILFEQPTFIDPLTGLFNRYYFYHFLPEEIKKAKLGNYPFAIFIVDLDDFKQVNDTFGHLRGDAVLKEIAEILKKRVRRTDAVIRYAGDEFAVFLPAVDKEKAQEIAHQLIKEIDTHVFKGNENQNIHLTLSVGFAVYPSDNEEMDTLIDMADKALYLSKQKGKNRVSHAKEVSVEAVSSLIAMESFPCPKLIDREEELNRMKQMFDTVITSNLLQAVFISGSTGVGKTRMLSEIKHHLNERAAFISCSASVSHTQDPYYLFAKGIGTHIETIGMENIEIRNLLAKLPVPELVELSLVVPEIARIVKRPNREIQDNKARFLLFKAFLDFLIELNKSTPLVISLDDIHMADKASLELLRYIIKQEKSRKILIIASFLEGQAKQLLKEGNLREVWEEIRFNDNVKEIRLDNLALEDISQMVNAIFTPLGEYKKVVELLYGITKGNPCFIEEILKSLVDNGFIVYQNNKWEVKKELTVQDIPASLEDVIKRRLKNLDEETKETIVQAAVIGNDFQVGLLKKIGNKDEGLILELVNRARKMRLIDELTTKSNFRFLNKITQEILYNELNTTERDDLHYKIAQAIAKQHKDNLYNVAGELAFHFSKAPQQEEARQHSRTFQEMASEIFDPTEIMQYLNILAPPQGIDYTRSIIGLDTAGYVFTRCINRSILKNSHFNSFNVMAVVFLSTPQGLRATPLRGRSLH